MYREMEASAAVHRVEKELHHSPAPHVRQAPWQSSFHNIRLCSSTRGSIWLRVLGTHPRDNNCWEPPMNWKKRNFRSKRYKLNLTLYYYVVSVGKLPIFDECEGKHQRMINIQTSERIVIRNQRTKQMGRAMIMTILTWLRFPVILLPPDIVLDLSALYFIGFVILLLVPKDLNR